MFLQSQLIWSGLFIAAIVIVGIFSPILDEAIAFRLYPPLGKLIDVGGFL